MSNKLNVLTISTKINRGGAGKVAFYIHSELSNGVFVYGYDYKGLKTKINTNNIVVKGSKLISPYINFIAYKIFGIDICDRGNKILVNMISKADIVHLHIIHSHGFNYKFIFETIIKFNKITVITAHDSWYYTGRCAIIHDCVEWKNQCMSCKHLNYYPSSILDYAHREYVKKNQLVNKIEKLLFISPSQWIAKDLMINYPSKKTIIIRNGIDTDIYKKKSFQIDKDKIHIVFITNDFNDHVKVDLEFLKTLQSLEYIHLHLIGKNCLYNFENTTIHGYLNREEIVNILHKSDILLFFSRIDNYPTVLIEGLCAGLHIASTKSKGADEVLSDFNYTEINKIEDFIDLIKSKKFISKVKNTSIKIQQKNKAIELFSSKNMLCNYSEIYRKLLK